MQTLRLSILVFIHSFFIYQVKNSLKLKSLLQEWPGQATT